jgi:hypothetical protein
MATHTVVAWPLWIQDKGVHCFGPSGVMVPDILVKLKLSGCMLLLGSMIAERFGLNQVWMHSVASSIL